MPRRNHLLMLLALVLACCVGGYLLLRDDQAGKTPDRAPERGDSPLDPDPAPPGGGVDPGRAGPEDSAAESGEVSDPGEPGDDAPEEGEAETGEARPFSFDDETEFSVRVRVLDPAGEPLEGTVEIVDPRYDFSLGPLPEEETGVFRGFLPAPGQYAARADWGGTRTQVVFEVSEEAPEAGVEVRFEGTGSVSGTVYTMSGGVEEGVRGENRVIGQTELAVELIPDPGPQGEPSPALSARVSDRGLYRIAGVPPGTYIVRIKNKYHASVVEVGEAAHVTHDIRLGGGRIFGRVTDKSSGDPLQEVQVVLQLSRAGTEAGDLARRAGFSSLSDRLRPTETGDYEFRNLPLGEYRLFSNGQEHAPKHGTVSLTESTPEARLDFALERGAAVDIAITDLDGRPLEGTFWMVAGIRCGFVGHVVGLRAGTFDFAAFAYGYEIQFRGGVVFKPGEATPLEFKLASEVATALEFVDPAGSPVEGVRVSLMKDGRNLTPYLESFYRERSLRIRTTGPDGRTLVRGVRAGPVRVVAKKSGFALFDEPIELKKAVETNRLELEPADTEFTWGVRIRGVSPGGPAERIGLRPGDVILTYAGTEITSIGALPQAIGAAKEAGAVTVKMTVERGGLQLHVDVVPGVLGVSLEEFELE